MTPTNPTEVEARARARAQILMLGVEFAPGGNLEAMLMNLTAALAADAVTIAALRAAVAGARTGAFREAEAVLRELEAKSTSGGEQGDDIRFGIRTAARAVAWHGATYVPPPASSVTAPEPTKETP